MGHGSRAFLAGGLGFAVAFVVACGGQNGLLTGNQASSLNGALTSVSSAVAAGQCGAATSAATDFNNQVAALARNRNVNTTLVQNLGQGAATLGDAAATDCQSSSASASSASKSASTSSSSSSSSPTNPTSTTNTNSTSTSPTSSTPSTTATNPTSSGTNTTSNGGAGLGGTTGNGGTGAGGNKSGQ